MKVSVESISVGDQDKALDFYTRVLGFVKKRDIDMGGGARWLTLISPDQPDGVELVLEPNAGYPAMKALRESLVKDGIPFTMFEVDDIENEFKRLQSLGVRFTMQPTSEGDTNTIFAVFDDTCGNLIMIFQQNQELVQIEKFNRSRNQYDRIAHCSQYLDRPNTRDKTVPDYAIVSAIFMNFSGLGGVRIEM